MIRSSPSSSSCSTVGFCSGKAWLGDSAFDGICCLHYGCCCVLHFSADTAVWWQQGKAVTCEGQGSGALGRLEWLPVPFNPVLLEFLAKLSVFFFFFLFFLLLHCVKLYQDTSNFIPVGCIELPLSRIVYGGMDDVSA